MSSTLSSHPTLTPNLTTTLRPNSTPTPSISLARSLPLPYDSILNISPLDLFLEQLNTDNAETRVDAMRRCFVVANAIGRDATLSSLIPYLANHVANASDGEGSSSLAGSDEEDEILLILAEQLGQMVLSGLIPGYRATSILPVLEKLAAVEETVVREKAVESINGIIPRLLLTDLAANPVNSKEDEDAREACIKAAPALLLAMVKRLSGADWFTAKVSACGILPAVYQFFNSSSSSGTTSSSLEETKSELRNLYKDLSHDDTPMVRRSAGKNLGKFVEAVATLSYGNAGSTGGPAARDYLIGAGTKDEEMIKSTVSEDAKWLVMEDMVPVYQALAGDEQDSVRLLAVSSSGSVGCALGLDEDLCGKVVLPVLKAGAADLSWRVRHHLAKEFSIVAQSQGYTSSSDDTKLNKVFQCFASLLQDLEAEVRASAVENIARMAQLGGAELFQNYIATLFPALADDPVMEVRSKLAQTMMDCCDESICTTLTDKIILQDFKPLLEGFLNDEFAEVQLHILSKLSRVSHLLNKMDAVVSSILAMTKAQNWRVRKEVGHLLPHLAEARGVNFFEDHLLDPWMKLLLDQVANVRSACVTGMPKLLSVAGSAWIQREILPHYVRIYEDSVSYLSRITILRSYAQLAEAEKGLTTGLLEEIVSLLLRGLDDRVANVRMVAARGLATISKACEDDILTSKIRPALNARVTEDEDEDCKYYAQLALEACS